MSTPAKSSPGDTGDSQRLATGNTVNVAARLEQAAPAGEVLIGESTYRLVRDAIGIVPVEPLELKGQPERVRPTGCSRSPPPRRAPNQPVDPLSAGPAR